MTAALINGAPGPDGQPITEMLLYRTGEFTGRFMITAMAISPLRLIWPETRFLRWLVNRRRYFGVAAFTYALAYTVLYLIQVGSLSGLLGEFLAFGIWTGWLALFIFIPLLMNLNDASVRHLRSRWKPLQPLVYLSALVTALHWLFVHNNLAPAFVHLYHW